MYLIARGTPGFSGADLSNLLNQAALRASQRKQANITLADMEWAKDKILMGMFAHAREPLLPNAIKAPSENQLSLAKRSEN